MRLADDFYTLIDSKRTERGWDAEVELNPAHGIYGGHFPGPPVVPGVCTLTIIRELLADFSGRGIRFSAIRECKFVGAIVPEPGLRLHFSMELEDNRLKCTASRKGETALKLIATID